LLLFRSLRNCTPLGGSLSFTTTTDICPTPFPGTLTALTPMIVDGSGIIVSVYNNLTISGLPAWLTVQNGAELRVKDTLSLSNAR
jgi:hypothetical protein